MVLGARAWGHYPIGQVIVWGGLMALLGGCGSPTPEAEGHQPLPEEEITPTAEDDTDGLQVTPIEPVRRATLRTQQPGAKVNLRSRPTTESTPQSLGEGGSAVDLLRLARGRDGYTWYYLTLVNDQTTQGWVRGDFVDTSSPETAQAPSTPGPASVPCGSDRQEAYFETQSFMVYLCSTAQGLRYVGTEKTGQQALITQDVLDAYGTYIAIDGKVQHHVNEQTLAVYQVSNGSYSQLAAEPVVRHEQFLY
jgi:hypothetical protein